MPQLNRIRVAGFKSIRDQEIELGSLNVLIGANGAGKSNFIGVFDLLHQIVHQNLQLAVGRAGGADQLLHFGRKRTEEILLHLDFEPNAYRSRLVPTEEDKLIFSDETVFFQNDQYSKPYDEFLGSGHSETLLPEMSKRSPRLTIADYVIDAFKSWKIYHFQDTSSSAKIKQNGDLGDNLTLRPDAGNLAAFLYRLRETRQDTYRNIVDAVKMVAPFFDDFDLRPDRLNPEKIRLEWREKGSDSYFNAAALSDGTLRFISLATLLLQDELPATVLLDEPELGLHPYAITLLAELLRAAAERTQVVVSTQSVTLVNQMLLEDVLVVDRPGGESVFRRLSSAEIESWLDDYALGELWEKNVVGETRPVKRVHVLAEGQTEETFLRDVLAQHLLGFDVHLTPIIVSTKRVKSGLKFKGGVTNYRQLKRDLRKLLGDRSADAVTTMVDYYGLPDDFPGVATPPPTASCYRRVAHLEEALEADLRDPRFLPYLSLHEFEALLLTSPVEIDATFPEQVADRLAAIVESRDSPEEIDDGPETHPAARISSLLPTYRKALHGPMIAARIGLEAMRRGCPHFNGWVTRLEEIGGLTS